MFFCEPCREANNWSGITPTSYGRCEECGFVRPCHDRQLPAPPKPPQTWSIPPEPGPEVTHLKDRHRQVWHRKGAAWAQDTPYGEVTWVWPLLFGQAYPLTDVSADYSIDKDLFDTVE